MIPESARRFIIERAKEMGYDESSCKKSKMGVNTKRLAADAGLSQSTVYRFLAGKTNPGYEKVRKLCHLLRIPYI